MHDRSHLRRWADRRPWPGVPALIGEVLHDRASSSPDRLAIVDGGWSCTFSELDAAVDDAAAALDSGSVVVTSGTNSAAVIIEFLAAMRAGAVWVGLDDRLPHDERRARRDRVGPTMAVEAGDPHSPAAVAFTSGTSGRAKAVVHSQHSMMGPAVVSAHDEPPRPAERIGTPLRLTTLNMMILGPLSALVRGTTFVVMRSTDAEGFSGEVERGGVTRAFVVPTILHDLVGSDVPGERLASVDRMIAGGSGGDLELLRTFADRFGVRPTLSYGLTEAPTGVVRESLDDPIGAGRGFPLPHVDVAIGDHDEIVVGPATAGPFAGCWAPMLGYLDDAAGTDRALGDGLLHTGDRGEIDGDGAVRVTGRRSALIVRGGTNIDATAVEAALRDHVGVVDACVVGIPDDRLGEAVAAMVVPTSGGAVDEGELFAHVGASRPRHEVPALVMLADEIPRNAMGKHDRAAVVRAITSKRA